MKILALGDPHGKLPKNLDGIIKKNKIEIIICTGDWALTPKKPWLEESWKGVSRKVMDKGYKKIINKICSYSLIVLTLRGNMYQYGEGRKIANKIIKKNKNLINKFTSKFNYKGKSFILFDVVFENSTIMKNEKKKNKHRKYDISKSKRRGRKLNKLLKENPNSILIVHNPPYGYVDKAFDGKHVGSKILLRAIKKYKPKLVLCGHIHEAKGEARIGKTKIYNLGWRGDYKILEV